MTATDEVTDTGSDVFLQVRRQWNDWRIATVKLRDFSGAHMSDQSGGVHRRSPRPFLHGYIWCDAIVEGELAHSCSHGRGPHRIKVCVVKKDNPPAVYRAALLRT